MIAGPEELARIRAHAQDLVFFTDLTQAFDVEALAIARGLGYHVLEVPVSWTHREDGHVRPGTYFETLVDVIRIRRALRAGNYELDRVLRT